MTQLRFNHSADNFLNRNENPMKSAASFIKNLLRLGGITGEDHDQAVGRERRHRDYEALLNVKEVVADAVASSNQIRGDQNQKK